MLQPILEDTPLLADFETKNCGGGGGGGDGTACAQSVCLGVNFGSDGSLKCAKNDCTSVPAVLPQAQSNSPGNSAVRTVPFVCLAGIVYFSVGGGPFGFEESISASSIALCFWTLIAAALLWALPQALCIAELSTLFRFGYNEWCTETLGSFCGFSHSIVRVVFSALTNAIYADLFATYALGIISLHTTQHEFLIRCALIAGFELCVASVNCAGGVRTVGIAMIALTVLVLSPFAVMLVLAIPTLTLKPLVDIKISDLNNADVPLLICSIMFNLAGWDFVGNVSSLARKPSRDVPAAIVSALVLVCVTYIVPLIVTASVLVMYSSDSGGSSAFVEAAKILWSPLAYCVTGAAFIGTFGLATSFMATSSEALAHSSQWGYLPDFITHRFFSHQTPIFIVLLLCLTSTAICIPWEYAQVVQLQMWLFAVSTLVILLGFLTIHWAKAPKRSPLLTSGPSDQTNPSATPTPPGSPKLGSTTITVTIEQGFKLRVGRLGSVLLCIPPMCLCLFAIVWTSWRVAVIGCVIIIFAVGVALVCAVVHKWKVRHPAYVPVLLTIEIHD
ncbi:Polyamine transporter PUT1 [Pelomyxa schiedti]|nr:Polyamine transporter PUT1 [Pelomyxa schiedti]